MPFKIKYIPLLSPFLLFSCAKTTTTSDKSQVLVVKEEEPKVVELASGGITRKELSIDLENMVKLDSGSHEEILQELLQRKLFIAEARSQGMDTTENFREQIQSHLSLAVASALEDHSEIRKLENEAYERYLKEVNASHLFVPISPYAAPADTLKLYNELLQIRNMAIQNKDFETQAKRWSKDPKTASSGGQLGWFSVFYLVYPLESAVYKVPKDSISLPVRTPAGYHLIKVNDIRKSSGMVQIQHIFKHIGPESEDKETLRKQLDSLRTEILNGLPFETAVEQHSDDFNSKPNKGILQPFGVGKTEPGFEEAVFALKKGEISMPIQSSTGLHLVKVIDRLKPLTRSQFIEQNRAKITTDSRGEYLRLKQINDFRAKNNVSFSDEALDNALKFASVRILTRNWQKPNTVLLTDPLLKINEHTITIGSFYDFVEDKQEFEKWPSENPNEIFKMLFDKFVEAEIVKYQQAQTYQQDPDLQRWMKAQEENILYTEFYTRNILEKSLQDTVALKRFYDANKSMFPAVETGNLSVMSFADEETYTKFKAMAAEPKPYKLYRGIAPILYEQNTYTLSEVDQRKLMGLLEIMEKNPGYIVEIGGHSDSKEDEGISELRIKEVVSFLVKNGLPLKRISEVNYKNSVIHDRFDWSKNQTLTFSFFSNLETDLAKTFNSKFPNAITYDNFTVSKSEFESKMNTSWGNKSGTIRLDGRVEEYTLKTKKIKGNYKDSKPEVIQKYQEALEKEWVQKLSSKFNLKYNPEELKSIINDLKKNN
jgi:peptidyl-prolyl cis-trans isomerase SurA